MRSLWGHKWSVVVGALVIFMSIGAVAWAIGDDPAPAGATGDTGVQVRLVGQEPAQGADQTKREALKEKRQERHERLAAMMEILRGQMSAADQALYDQLVATAKEKRDAIREAREDLNETLKELRELTDKYLDVDGAGGSD